MGKYAGIGSRKTPKKVLNLMWYIAYLLAKDGVGCVTGACVGPDQEFANGAIAANGELYLKLPWFNYEKAWVDTIRAKKNVHVQILKDSDYDAMNSVDKYHPAPEKLTKGPKKLHARNFLILTEEELEYVICYTEHAKASGGTGQGIRIAQDLGIKIYNLGDIAVLKAFTERIRARSAEIPGFDIKAII